MFRVAIAAALLVAVAVPRETRAHATLVGTWELVSRNDRDSTGRILSDSTGRSPDPNNNANIGGYSAYFGHYQVDPKAGTVTHVLEGALAPADIGKRLRRRFRLVGDTLTIQFEPATPEGGYRTRTLVWHRVSS